MSLLLRYPWVSVWTVEDEEGPQGEPQQADGTWMNRQQHENTLCGYSSFLPDEYDPQLMTIGLF